MHETSTSPSIFRRLAGSAPLTLALLLHLVAPPPPASARGADPCAPQASGGLTPFESGNVISMDAALFADGSGIAVWAADNQLVDEPSGNAVLVQRIGADGAARGLPVVVNTLTDGDQDEPAVAAAPDGRFVVVWTSDTSPGDDENTSIRGRLYRADGTPAGPDFQVNSTPFGSQRAPDVAMADDGSFVAVWYDDSDSSGTPSQRKGREIRARRFRGDGTPLGGDFVANDRTDGIQDEPAIAIDPDGRFVVVFSSATGSPGDDTDRSIQARLYGSDGAPEGGQFQVNTTTPGTQSEPAVAMDPDGSFLVVWKSASSPGSDQDRNSIQARGFTRAGAGTGPQQQVNDEIERDQFDPQVAAAGGREFLAVWLSRAVDDRVKARGLDLLARPLGPELQPGGASQARTLQPAVGGNGAGRTVVLFERSEIVSAQGYALPCAVGATDCVETATNLCLTSGRFDVTVAWRNTAGASGIGRSVELTPDTGYFWFFDSANVETVVKVLDACAFNDRFWVFIGGLTDLDVEVTIEDVDSGVVRRYQNPQGVPYATVNDTSAFDTCP